MIQRLRWPLALLSFVVLCGIGLAGYRYQQREPAQTLLPAPAVVHAVVGTSVEGRFIDAYTYGTGARRFLFVGGVHGGYEWNSTLLAYRFMDYLASQPGTIASGTAIMVIPSANPDGLYKVVGTTGRFAAANVTASAAVQAEGRFNANEVDLNRNFNCKWQPRATWRSAEVSAGQAPFSEPEARAIRTVVLAWRPTMVVFWHSQANAVYASECKGGILAATRAGMTAYAQAAGYPAVDTFDAYAVTGDAEGWLASIGVPAITVELSSHEGVDWDKNLAGVKALLGLPW